MKTESAKSSEIDRKWYLIDAEGLVVGRLASAIATILRGKHKTNYTPHVDCGDNVVVINVDKVQFTGKKLANKEYFHHTGHPGGIKSITAAKIMEGAHPERVLEKAVERMISRNKLGSQMMTKLKLYKGSEHPHAAQKPEVLDIAARNPKNVKRG